MNKYDVVKQIENFAPLEIQEKWDASGWIVDKTEADINKIMFALTITKNVFEQAIKEKCDMIISHHPLFTVPLGYSKINMYCAHTNFDKALGGTTDILIKILGLKSRVYNDFVRIVDFDSGIAVEDFKQKLLEISPKLRYINNSDKQIIRTVGFCAGSGSEFIEETPCDAFVTGDLKFHTTVEAEKIVFDIGHFESEIFAVKALHEITQVGNKGIIADEKSPFI